MNKKVIEFNKNDSVELKFFNQYYLEQANQTQGIDSPEYNKSLANLNVFVIGSLANLS